MDTINKYIKVVVITIIVVVGLVSSYSSGYRTGDTMAGKYKKVLGGAAEIPIAWNAGTFMELDFSKEHYSGMKGDRVFIADNYVAPTDSMEVGGEFGRDSVCIGPCDGHAIVMSIIPQGASLTTYVATAQSTISADYKWSKMTIDGISADVLDYVPLEGGKFSGEQNVFIRYQKGKSDFGIIFTFLLNHEKIDRFLKSLNLDMLGENYYLIEK